MTAKVVEVKQGTDSVSDAPNVVVWLSSLDNSTQGSASPAAAGQSPQLVQHNKTFEPHILVVRVGTVVQFPNRDPFFHNIFSLYDGKRFDLGIIRGGYHTIGSFRPTGCELPVLRYTCGNERVRLGGGIHRIRDFRSPGPLAIPNARWALRHACLGRTRHAGKLEKSDPCSRDLPIDACFARTPIGSKS